jgi:hypothetical protein
VKRYIKGAVYDFEQLGIKYNSLLKCSRERLVSALTKEIEAQKRVNHMETGKKKTLGDNRLTLGTTYIRILEMGEWASDLLRQNFILISFGSED